MNADSTPADASRLGADLRAARERLGWSLDHVAASLRIRYPYLLAIEEGRVSDLPGNAYALGFVRTYAASLGLDPDEVARRFRAEAGAVNRRTELQFPVPVPERGVPAGAVVLLGVVIAVGAYIGWYRYSGEHRAAEAVQDVPARLAPLAKPSTPAMPSQSPSSAAAASPAPAAAPSDEAPPVGENSDVAAGSAPQPAATSAAPATPGPSAESSPAAVSGAGASPGTAAAATPSTPEPPAKEAGASGPAAARAANGAPAATPASAANGSRIVLHATADSWIQVRAPHGPVLFNRILHPGESWSVPPREPGKPPLLLTTGNAGGTELVVDGTTMAALGPSGSVRRDIPLDAASIKDGDAAPGGHGASATPADASPATGQE